MLNGVTCVCIEELRKTMAKIRHTSDRFNYGKPVVCHNATHTRTFLFVLQAAVTVVHYKTSVQTCYLCCCLKLCIEFTV